MTTDPKPAPQPMHPQGMANLLDAIRTERPATAPQTFEPAAAHMVAPHTDSDWRYKNDGRDSRGVVSAAEGAFLKQGLGAELRRLRTAAGFTQQQTGELAGLDRKSVSRFELGQLRPTVWALGTLARTLSPRGQASDVLARLVELAGGSARRDAKERLRYRAECRAHLEALAKLQSTVERLQASADVYRRAGRPVPAQIMGLLKPLSEQLGVLKDRVLPELLPEPEGRRGLTTAAQDLARYGSMPKTQAGMRAWYAEQADRESAPQPLTSTNTSDAHDVNTPEHLPNTIQEAQ